ncbi:UNVERIFIED_CONTAM: hypothetical protein NCL1_49479 [Trichonephila clavipes]
MQRYNKENVNYCSGKCSTLILRKFDFPCRFPNATFPVKDFAFIDKLLNDILIKISSVGDMDQVSHA